MNSLLDTNVIIDAVGGREPAIRAMKAAVFVAKRRSGVAQRAKTGILCPRRTPLPMKRTIRIGSLADQDRFRRDDLRKATPAQRVDMLLQLQERYFSGLDRTIQRVATIKRIASHD